MQAECAQDHTRNHVAEQNHVHYVIPRAQLHLVLALVVLDTDLLEDKSDLTDEEEQRGRVEHEGVKHPCNVIDAIAEQDSA